MFDFFTTDRILRIFTKLSKKLESREKKMESRADALQRAWSAAQREAERAYKVRSKINELIN